jgi:cbb3-type cytochrome oxidase subunit 3
METLSYETAARFGMISSLLLFVAMFIAVLVYVLFFAGADKLEEAQRKALDLDTGNGHTNLRGRA